jgi:LAO/AO transport system kinase
MEIGDIFVINKAEREGVERTERELIALLEMSERSDSWKPLIVRTVATQSRGITEFADAIENYALFRRQQLASAPRRASVAENRLVELLREGLLKRILNEVLPPGQLRELAAAVASRQRDPYTIVEEIVNKVRIK